jgi:ubiquinol-cytochrome c reductase cytochrome b subunit
MRVTEAFESTVNISFKPCVAGSADAPDAPLVLRHLCRFSIVVHMARVFFTGAFRKPRELNWSIGLTLLTLAIVNGFLGYSLPDDLVSGTGIRIAYSIVLSIPLVGTYLGFFAFGGNFPGTSVIPRFFIMHVLIVPGIMLGLVGAHMFLLYRQKHTQFPGEGRTEKNVVGSPMFPVFMAKTTGFLLLVTGVTALLGAFAQINPIWQFGPVRGFADLLRRAARLVHGASWTGRCESSPSWSFHSFGYTIPFEVFDPRRHISGHALQRGVRLADPRAPVHQGQRDAQPARPAEQPAQAHRGRRRRCWPCSRCCSSRAPPTSSQTSSTSRSRPCSGRCACW